MVDPYRLEFAGSGDPLIDLGNHALGTNFAIEAWANADDSHRILFQGNTGFFWATYSHLQFGDTSVPLGASVFDNWHHYMIARKGNEISYFLDGVIVGTPQITTTSVFQLIRISE